MSYCRFQNTSQDLQDCIDAVEEMNKKYYYQDNEARKELSKQERNALEEMIEQARYYSQIATDLLEELEAEQEFIDPAGGGGLHTHI
tara:strand:+ start:1710 stop:1970 length:261 start_codon:yes stop_codon:yes gene_type:complete